VISLLTCTGARPEAFALLEGWIRDQTFQSFEWIVVDDGPEPTPVTMGQRVLRPKPFWDGSQHTLLRNLSVGLAAVRCDRILFIEDDEVYLPTYVERMAELMGRHMLVGETPARYYNLRHWAYRVLPNRTHASLCQTGMQTALSEALIRLCARAAPARPFVDLELWRAVSSVADAGALLVPGSNVVSLKCLPGRGGIGIGHRVEPRHYPGWTSDFDRKQLTQWIGADRVERVAATVK
jgi:hypothetical protein